MKKTLIALLLSLGSLSAHAALDPAQVRQLAAEDSTDKVAAIRQLTQTADPDAVRVLKAMAEDSLFLAGDKDGNKAVIIDGDKAFDAATGAAIKMPASPESVTVNNRIRGELSSALAALKLFDSRRGRPPCFGAEAAKPGHAGDGALAGPCAGKGKRWANQGLADFGLRSGQSAQC
jgi:urea transport system permease protein